MSIITLLKNFYEGHPLTTTEPPLARSYADAETTELRARRIRKATPSRRGLYPDEILMLSHAHEYTTRMKNRDFPHFWHTYGIQKPQQLLQYLQEGGFVEVVPTHHYQLTKAGQEELAENTYVAYLAQRPNGPRRIWWMNYLLHRQGAQSLSVRKILLTLYEKEARQALQEGHMRQHREALTDIYHFLLEDPATHTAASKLLCKLAAHELSGMADDEFSPQSHLDIIDDPAHHHDDGFDVLDVNPHSAEGKRLVEKGRLLTLLRDCFPYGARHVCRGHLSPAVRDALAQYRDSLALTAHEWIQHLEQQFSAIPLPRQIFSPQEHAAIVAATLDNHTDTLQRIYQNAEERLRKQLEILEKEGA